MAGGGLARLHGRQRHKLYPHRPIFGRPVRCLQLLQAGEYGPAGCFVPFLFFSLLTELPRFQFFESSPGASLGPYQRLVCGGWAGITSVVCTYPLDIVRTRLSIQSASFEGLRHQASEKLPGMGELLVSIYKTEGGVKALYRGIVPTIAGVAPYVSLFPIPLIHLPHISIQLLTFDSRSG